MTTMLALAITDERMPYRTADTRDMELVHRAVLRYADYLAAVAPRVSPSDPAAAEKVRDVADTLVAMIRALHNAQDDLLWPTLRVYLEAADACAAKLDAVIGRQAELIELCGALQRAVGTPQLAAASAALARTLDRCLSDVERVALPAAGQYMTERQWRELIDRVIADLASGDNAAVLLGGLLYGASRRERARISRSAPGGLLTAQSHRRAFGRRFAAAQAVLGPER